MAALLDTFLDPSTPSLKICGVTTSSDATRLADLGVEAVGINFWKESKRFCPIDSARAFLPLLKDRLVRVGVFVNADPAEVRSLFAADLIDLAQFHGDETIDYCAPFAHDEIPFLKAIGVTQPMDLEDARSFRATGLILDAHAPDVYGGTGHTIDWNIAADFVTAHPDFPVILAGGITPENATAALAAVHPAALDVASGSEQAPGIKDFAKVEALQEAVRAQTRG